MDNRREHPRYELSLAMEVFTGTEIVLARAQNLSLGGVGIATHAPLKEQSQVGLSMFLVEDGIEDERTEPLNLGAEVVWCTPADAGGFLAGVRFVSLPPQHVETIKLFLGRLTSGR